MTLRRLAAGLAMLAVFGVLGLAARGGGFTSEPAASTAASAAPSTASVSAPTLPDPQVELERARDAQNKALAKITALRVATVFYVIVVLALIGGGIVFVIGYWRDGGRRRRLTAGSAAPAWSGPVPATTALAVAVDAGLVLVEHGEAREAVVACWLLLGRAAAAAGSPARPAETAAEYTDRLGAEQVVSGAALRRLAELYREARFSEHEVSAELRANARRALSVLQAELRAGVAL